MKQTMIVTIHVTSDVDAIPSIGSLAHMLTSSIGYAMPTYHVDNTIIQYVCVECHHVYAGANDACNDHVGLCDMCILPMLDYYGNDACGVCIDNMDVSPYVCMVDGCTNPSMYDDNVCQSCQVNTYAICNAGGCHHASCHVND